MSIPLEISFRNIDKSEFIESDVNHRYERLIGLYAGITRCHVVIAAPHQHQSKGRQYKVHLEVRVPGTELAVSRNTGESGAHEDLYVALRDAFSAMERQLLRWAQKRRHDVKAHSLPAEPELKVGVEPESYETT